MRAAAFALVLMLSGVATVTAQPALPTCKEKTASAAGNTAQPQTRTYQDLWCDRVFEIVVARKSPGGTGAAAGARQDIENAVEIASRNWAAFLLYAQARSALADTSAIEDARTDKQIGAPASAGGSTSLVSKGSVPAILAFAVENGALTQVASATTVTLRGNLVGWLDLLKNQDFISSYQDGSSVVRQLRRVSYSLTLNTDTSAAAPERSESSGLAAISRQAIRDRLAKSRQQLAGYSVRIAILDQRDPRTAANRASIATLLDTKGVELLKSDNAFAAVLNSEDYNRKWMTETVDLLSDPTRNLSVADVQRILYQRLEIMRLLMINRIEGFDDEVARALLALQAYDKARVRIFQAMQKRPLVAFEYVNARASDLPDTSTFRLITEGQWGSRLDLTANVAWTQQHSGTVLFAELPEPGRIGGRRDFQVAGQLDVPLASIERRVAARAGIGAPVLGFAFLSQHLNERGAVSFAGSNFAVDPGWIHVVQAKVMVPVKGSGVKIPLSVSYSNRTELLKEKEIRGHIGLTFDMDVLSSMVRR
jgi:hypothetical protein